MLILAQQLSRRSIGGASPQRLQNLLVRSTAAVVPERALHRMTSSSEAVEPTSRRHTTTTRPFRRNASPTRRTIMWNGRRRTPRHHGMRKDLPSTTSTTGSSRAEEEDDENRRRQDSDHNDDDFASSGRSYVSIAQAKQLPYAYHKMDNVSLVTLAGLGEHAARTEVLIRHIMAVDNVPYPAAYETFLKIKAANQQGMYLFLGLPFQLGAASMVISGVLSIPLVFDLTTVEWFNELYVTADVPPPKDLETWLEVGAWSWNWMEPLLGTSTFILLCMQYFRINMDHLGIKPYTHRMKNNRAERLVTQFPRYDRQVLIKYSETATIYT